MPAAAQWGRAALGRLSTRPMLSSSPSIRLQNRSAATMVTELDLNDLDPDSTLQVDSTPAQQAPYDDPLARSRARKNQLPSTRYKFRSPKYYRGPLHPHQPPKPSDPSSREFIPGPFTLPRLQQTYDSTVASDLLALSYKHYPPGYQPLPKGPRLRSWDGPSPYHKNRPLRGPRGGSNTLSLLKRRITFRNVPRLTGITVHTFAKEALKNGGALHVAGMVLQAMTGVRCQAHVTRHSEVKWGLRAGKFASVTSDLRGEDMYHFFSKLVDVVLPRIREWQGVKGSSGDDNGNITFGLTPEMVALFPEIEVNYDSYPPALIPGCHITIKTSATTDRDGRLLLNALGLPFYGKLVS